MTDDLDDAEQAFNAAAAKAALAYAVDDNFEGNRLYETFHTKYLRPHMLRFVPIVTANYDQRLRELVYSQILWRLAKRFVTGTAVKQRELASIYRAAAFDVHVRTEERQTEGQEFTSDAAWLSHLIDTARQAEHQDGTDDEALTAITLARVRDRVHGHLIDTFPRRKLWAPVWLEMCSGDLESASIARRLSITRTRASQVKDEIGAYLFGTARHLIPELLEGRTSDSTHGAAA